MIKPRIRIIDSQFSHCGNGFGSFGTGDLGIPPSHFDWHRGEQISELVVVTENSFNVIDTLKEKNKVALIIEPYSINPNSYEWIKANHDKFSHVLTYNLDLMEMIPNAVFYVFGGCWIWPNEQAVYEKTKGVSIIASDKNITSGHLMRHTIINNFRDYIDGIYGRGYNFIQNKITALRQYRYSVVVESEYSDIWLTEKLIDCFATGTIPIFWGTEKVREYFDEEGILFFSSLSELHECLIKATPEYYQSHLHAVNKNYELCRSFMIPENNMYKTFFEPNYLQHD